MNADAIERAVKHLIPKAPTGFVAEFEVTVHTFEDAFVIRAWRHARDVYGDQLRKTYRSARVIVPANDLLELEHRGAPVFVDYFRDRLRYLFAILFPVSRNFRISTKNHVKRLVPR